MTTIRKHAQIKPDHIAAMTDARLSQQARMAEEYAANLPASDLDGFFAAMRDAEAMRAEIKTRQEAA